jgi:protein-S-isoprenylcysteine O-methyltransferase Ste14
MVRGFLILVFYLTFLIVAFFFPAGRLDVWTGWTFLGIYTLISIINFSLADPELVKERSRIRSGTNRWDARLAALSFLFFYPITLVIAGLDTGRMGWTKPYPIVFQFIALILYTLGNIIGSWALLSNRYFSTFIRLQEDRGHEVVTQGPYRFIRHPGYAGTILAAIALPIGLGSEWALIPATIGGYGFILRTKFEDEFLLRELNGYNQYASVVRYRLFPGVW